MLDEITLGAVLGSWSFEPAVVAGLGVGGGLYGIGLCRLWLRVGTGVVVSRWRIVAFATGVLVIALALLSPIAAFTSFLFSMHMAQHLLLTMVGAPLLLVGAPSLPLLWSLPADVRRAVGRGFAQGGLLRGVFGWLTSPLAALGLHTFTTWVWHLPRLYDASLRFDSVHHLQHAMFLGTALLFWWPAIRPLPGRRRMSEGLVLLYLVAGSVALMKLPGALLTFAAEPIYSHYAQVPRIWLSARDDQQLAGVLMGVVGFLILGLAFTVVFYSWATRADREEPWGRVTGRSRPRPSRTDGL